MSRAAVDGYRNADGGYGWAPEPDLRAPESQPGGALHTLEVFAEVCDWLGDVTLPDGGVPVADPAGVRRSGSVPTLGRLPCRAPRSSPGSRIGSGSPRSGFSTPSTTRMPRPRRCSSSSAPSYPLTGRPARQLFGTDVIADLRRLAGGQQEVGGWLVDFDSCSPAAALEWRGYATVQAVSMLRANGIS